jgi:hypothetical protein
MGSMPVIFEFRFGFDAIFAAMGLSFVSVVVEPEPVFVDVEPLLVEVDPDVVDVVPDFFADVAFAGLAVFVVVGLPVGFAAVVGFPLIVGLPEIVGLPVGLLPAASCESASAGDSVRHAAAAKPRIVAESRIRYTSKGGAKWQAGCHLYRIE